MKEYSLNIWAIFILLMSPFVGSFLALIVDRWPRGEAVVMGRSRCRACHATLSWFDLIPIISWLLLHGNCRHCKAAIGYEAALLEFAAILLAVWALSIGNGWAGPAGALLAWGLLSLGWIDAKHFYLPDILTLPLIAGGLLLIAVFVPERLMLHGLGAVIAYGTFRGINWIYLYLRGRGGLGHGDAKLLAAAGAWLGGDALPSVVLIGAVLALISTIVRRITLSEKLRLEGKIPFGLYLCMATWFVWVFGALVLS